MRRLPVVALPILVAALVACSSSAAPGWTYAPAASPSAAASGAASGAPSGAPSTAPSTAPSATASTSPSAAASASASASASGSTVLTLKAPVGAATGGFDPTTLSAAAGKPFTIHFDNEDNQAPHNVVVKAADGSQVKLGGDTNFFTGPGERDYQVPALTAGTYEYNCAVHPTTMKGTLTIQ